MQQQVYSRSVNILRKFDSTQEGNYLVLYEPGNVTPYDTVSTLRYYGFITDLRLKVDINSIAESTIPDLELTSSRTERILAVRDMEWTAPRKEFRIYMETSMHPIVCIAHVSLLNRLPYYHINLLPYFTDNGLVNIASDARLLGQIVNAGWGFLQGSDEVIAFGSVREEVTVLPEHAKEIQFSQGFTWTIGTNSAQILPSNPNRLQATFVNHSSTAKVFLNYGNLAEAGKGLCLMPNGGSYEINLTNPYTGLISAIASEAGATLAGLECV